MQRLPEFALAGCPFARADQRHLVARGVLIARSFGAPHRLRKLRAGGRRRADQVEIAMPPVRRHLASATGGVRRRAHRLLQHLARRHPERETQSAVAIVRIEPIVRGAHRHPRRHLDRLMPGAGNLEVDAVLPLQRHFAVVQPPRCVHQAEGADEVVRRELGETVRMISSAGSPAKRSVVDDCCAVLSVATPVRPPKSSVLTLRPGGALKPAGSYAANGTPGMAADRLAYGDAAYVPLRSSATCPSIPQKGALFGNDIGRMVELAVEEASDGSELEKPGAGTIELGRAHV